MTDKQDQALELTFSLLNKMSDVEFNSLLDSHSDNYITTLLINSGMFNCSKDEKVNINLPILKSSESISNGKYDTSPNNEVYIQTSQYYSHNGTRLCLAA